MLVIKCNSHRARDKFQSKLGLDLIGYYLSYNCKKYQDSKGIYLITLEEYNLVKDIKGISHIKVHPNDLGICWIDRDITEARRRMKLYEEEFLTMQKSKV